MDKITYKSSGVDIKKATLFKQKIKSIARVSFTPGALRDIGGFGSFFGFTKDEYKEPVLVSSADGVGTKLKIAGLVNKHDTVGIDAVAMNTNDILCTGARPLFFLDYIAYSSIGEDTLVEVVKGLNRGCIESGCALIGGETAQMPGMYRSGEYDLAGFCVGAVEKKNIIDGSKIEAGDAVIGLESNGLHSNGFSLVRKVFSKTELKRMGKELLKPTRIYVKPVLSLLSHKVTKSQSHQIRGISHITGGAFYDKIARILPDNISVRIKKNSWQVPPVFKLIQNKGGISDKEMYHTLNMGIGMVLIIEHSSADRIIAELAKMNLKSWVIGEAVKGKKEVEVY
ncbi:MAG: phosphoribosylformylglycinamidine cyclo-ligase [Candidatus Omnitrophota bacterium]